MAKKKCPFGRNPGAGDLDCLHNVCALWESEEGICTFADIANSLAAIAKTLGGTRQ